MTQNETRTLLNAIHKNKNFHPTDDEIEFLEALSINLNDPKFEVSRVAGEFLQKIYHQSQE